MNEMLDVGPGGHIARRRIIAIARWDSAPVRRTVNEARKEGRLIDLTFGRACRWVVFLDSGHLALVARSDLVLEESEKKP